MQKLHEISFDILVDGTISLEQPNGFDEPSVILLHPEQIRFIARRVCGLNESTAAKVSDLERKLSVLAGRLDSLVSAKWFRSGILDGCADGGEMIGRLDGLVDLAIEMDGGRLLPSEPKKEPKKESKFQPMNPPANYQQPDMLS